MLDAIKMVLSATSSISNQDSDIETQLKELISDEFNSQSFYPVGAGCLEEEF